MQRINELMREFQAKGWSEMNPPEPEEWERTVVDFKRSRGEITGSLKGELDFGTNLEEPVEVPCGQTAVPPETVTSTQSTASNRAAVLGTDTLATPGNTRILIQPGSGPLPEMPEELLAVIDNPASVAQGVGALSKLGEIYGRDVVDDNAEFSYDNFHPTVIFGGISGNPDTNRTFVACAIPLRRALARHFQPRTPEIAMMLDILALSYWRWFQAERLAIHLLERSLADPRYLDGLQVAERAKESAVRMLGQMLQGLRLLTGRDLGVPAEDPLRNIIELTHVRKPVGQRKRAASSK